MILTNKLQQQKHSKRSLKHSSCEIKCYSCQKVLISDKILKKLARNVVFCSTKCLNNYLSLRSPNTQYKTNENLSQVHTRLLVRRSQIEEELQFLSPNSHKYHTLEEIFFELTTILEGREIITSHLHNPIQIETSVSHYEQR
jgi:hypothetical protein